MNTTTHNPASGTPKPKPDAVADQPKLVQVHDLVGAALLGIPPELEQILGDKKYRKYMQDIEALFAVLIIRVAGHVVYLRCPLMTGPFGEEHLQPAHFTQDREAQSEGAAPPAAKAPTRAGRKPRDKA
jgi:hypothetical protein